MLLLLGTGAVCVVVGGVFVAQSLLGRDAVPKEAQTPAPTPQASKTPTIDQKTSPETAATSDRPSAIPPEPPLIPPPPTLPPISPTEPPAGAPAASVLPVEPPVLPPEPDLLPSVEQTAEQLRQEALEVAHQLLQRYPDSPDTVALIGSVYEYLGKTAEAMKYWETCLEIDPRRVDVKIALAAIALERDEYARAVELSREAARIAPEALGVHRDLARALMAQGQFAEAVESLEREIRRHPHDATSRFLLAQARLQQRQYEEAKNAYQAVISIRPDHAKAHHGLMIVCARLGEKAESLRCAEKFSRLDTAPRDAGMRRRGTSDYLDLLHRDVARTHTGAGRIYARQGDHRNAESLLRRAARIDPNNWVCRQELAAAYLGSGRRQPADELCDELIEIDDDNAACYFNTGGLLIRLRRFADAERAVRRGIELAPQDAAGYRYLVRVLQDGRRKPADAVDAAKRLVALEPTAANYLLLADACRGNGDRAGAEDARQRAAKLDRENGAAARADRQRE